MSRQPQQPQQPPLPPPAQQPDLPSAVAEQQQQQQQQHHPYARESLQPFPSHALASHLYSPGYHRHDLQHQQQQFDRLVQEQQQHQHRQTNLRQQYLPASLYSPVYSTQHHPPDGRYPQPPPPRYPQYPPAQPPAAAREVCPYQYPPPPTPALSHYASVMSDLSSMHPLGPKSYLPSSPQSNPLPAPVMLEPALRPLTMLQDPGLIDPSRRQLADLRRSDLPSFTSLYQNSAPLQVENGIRPGAIYPQPLSLAHPKLRTLDRQRYLPASSFLKSSIESVGGVSGAKRGSADSEDDPYIDITGNSTPMLLRSPSLREDADDDAEGDSETENDGKAGEQNSRICEPFDPASALAKLVPGRAVSAIELAGAKKKAKPAARGKGAATRGGKANGAGPSTAAARKKSGDSAAPKKPRAPKPKRSRKESIVAAALGERAALGAVPVKDETKSEPSGYPTATSKPETLLQLMHAASFGRKRKRVDYAALLRGAGNRDEEEADTGSGWERDGTKSPAVSTPNSSSPKAITTAAGPQSSDDPNRVYCLCRQPLSSSTEDDFYIGCEGCDEWFHGRCVDVTPQDARGIEKYMCSRCEESGSKTVRKRACAAADCDRYVEPPSAEASPAPEGPTPFPRPPRPWQPTSPSQRRRYCSEPCALATARTKLHAEVAPPLRRPATPPREEQAPVLESRERLSQWHAVQQADRADLAALASFTESLKRRRSALKRLLRRRDRIRGAISAARDLHATTASETVALADRICGYDFRIATEWVVDVDEDDDDGDDDDSEATDKKEAGNGADETAAPPLCEAKGRCACTTAGTRSSTPRSIWTSRTPWRGSRTT